MVSYECKRVLRVTISVKHQSFLHALSTPDVFHLVVNFPGFPVLIFVCVAMASEGEVEIGSSQDLTTRGSIALPLTPDHSKATWISVMDIADFRTQTEERKRKRKRRFRVLDGCAGFGFGFWNLESGIWGWATRRFVY